MKCVCYWMDLFDLQTQQVNIAHRKLLKQSSSSEGMEKSIKLVEEERDALQNENDKLRLQIADLR